MSSSRRWWCSSSRRWWCSTPEGGGAAAPEGGGAAAPEGGGQLAGPGIAQAPVVHPPEVLNPDTNQCEAPQAPPVVHLLKF